MSLPLQQAIRATPYPAEAYRFLENGLAFSTKRVHGDPHPDQPKGSRHISGAQLAEGLRDFAIQEYGLFSRFLLERWRITRTRDFGEMVFALIDAGLLSKTESDTLADFNDVYDFKTAFPAELLLSPLPSDCHGQD